jgi:hypothetical protein
MDNNIKNFKKIWMNSLFFLDNPIVNVIIVVVLFLYVSCLFDNINNFVGNLYNFSIVRIIVLLLIIYVSPKDTTIAILLTLSYIISVNYMVNNEETFIGKIMTSAEESMYKKGYKPPKNNSVERKNRYMSEESNRPSMKSENTKEHFFPVLSNNDNENSFNLSSEPRTRTDKIKQEPPRTDAFFPLMDNRDVSNSFDSQLKDISSIGNMNRESFFPLMNNNDSSNSFESIRKNNSNNQMMYNEAPVNEHFFPVINNNDNSNSFNLPDLRNVKPHKNRMVEKKKEMKRMEPNNMNANVDAGAVCLDHYNEKYEAVGDVCQPVATFQGELNPQGINFPMGFDTNVNGSPLLS